MSLRTIGLIGILAIGLLVWALGAEAQESSKVYRIGWLGVGSIGSARRDRSKPTPQLIAFRQELRELGYVEGKNLVSEYRWAEGRYERLPDLAAELVRLKVDVIVTSSAQPVVRAVQRTTSTIPIVMAGTGVDPVKAGFVVSLARPGGNITGMTNLAWELHPKRLALLKEAFPQISRVAILWSPTRQSQRIKEVETAGQALGIEIQSLLTRHNIESVFSAISQVPIDGLLVESWGLVIRNPGQIAEFAVKRRLPTIFGRSRFVKAGGLMSYGTNRPAMYRRVAIYVDKILKGAKPADLPVEQPTKFDLFINLKTANQIGVTIPSSLLYRADKVIK